MNTETNLCKLLPWYVNGTLDAVEMQQFSEHLQNCGDCGQEIDETILISQAIQEAPIEIQRLQGRQTEGLDLLREKISTQTQSNHRAWWSPILAEPLAAFACLSLLVFAGYILWQYPNTQPNHEYELLTQTQAGQASLIQVVFEPDTTEQQKRDILLALELEIVGGPSDSGVYRLSPAEGANPENTAEQLQQLNEVRWTGVERQDN